MDKSISASEIAKSGFLLQRKWEDHRFQWVDEALAEKISLVEERQREVDEALAKEICLVEERQIAVEEELVDMRKTEKSENDVALQNNGCLSVFGWLCCKLW
ncbi:unnamed protein product [Eruca vesicaria subsp. sativa]|uniref:Uncharacterized protein n=1 Tax=Eruca vesicaria subsp. sativa TaxID=29727 RepID=A0ABC8KXV8_ERUVS|nr:unnamed protein product [Eruca vesicaria subsp. sativa]